jgi:hypothetical protein
MTQDAALVVPLEWVCATVPDDEGYDSLTELETEADLRRLGQVAEAGHPIWLELALPELGEDEPAQLARHWFQGTLDAWLRMPVPVVGWDAVAPILHAVGLQAPQTPTARTAPFESRFLEALPHLYGRGVARTIKELQGRGDFLTGTSMFPTVGFLSDGDEEGLQPEFWTVRVSVAVIRNLVITLRLPDVLCSGEGDDPRYRSGARALAVRTRFLPLGRHATQEDIAEGIAIYQSATIRAVAERIRRRLRSIEREAPVLESEGAPAGRASTTKALEGLHESILKLTETVLQLDRQIASLLRRFGAYGEGDDGVVPRDVKLRYGFGLDEIRSLREDCRLARDTVSERITALDQAGRDQFQVIAAVLGSAILVPGLVAAIYSADVRLPAENSWPGFAMLMLLIIGFSTFGLWLVTRIQRSPHIPGPGERMERWLPAFSALAVVLGIVVAVAAPEIWGS